MKQLAKNLRYLREQTGIPQAEMSVRLGFSKTTWNNYERDTSQPSLTDLSKILEFYEVSASQLLEQDLQKGKYSLPSSILKKAGKGEFSGDYSGKFKGKEYPKPDIVSQAAETESPAVLHSKIPQVITVDSQGNENVILVPVKARAGYLNGYADPDFISGLPAYRLPGLNNGTFRLFEVEGLSMYPTLFGGDLVIGSNVDQLGTLRDDRIHVIVTKNDGVVVKRVLNRIKTDGKLILKSDNYKDRDMYPPIVCDPQDIIEIWYVTGFISRQMRPPAEMYNRLIDLEGRFTLLEAQAKKHR